MRTSIWRRTGSVLVSALVVAGVATVGPAATAAPVTINLCAVAGTVALPGAASVPIWGFARVGTPGACAGATPTLPGPVLDVNQGDTVTLNVTNALPGTRQVHVDIPGISFDPGGVEAASGATVTISFTASRPGTYLYQSSGDAGRQTAMGLYGALIVRPPTAGQAYNDPSTAYTRESVLVLSALDPAFNANPDGADLNDYLATYWMINGKSYPGTDPITAAAGDRLLIRYVNAGFDHTTMSLLGTHERVVARDGEPVPAPFDAVSETIPAGATEDAIVTMPGGGAPSANGFALFNRQLHLTNGTLSGPTPTPGGMMTFIHP